MNDHGPAVRSPPNATTQLVSMPVCFEGALVALRPACMSDLPAFYEWRIDAEELYLWALSRRIPSVDEFRAEFERHYLTQMTFVVGRKADGAVVGFVQAYNVNPEQGWASILVNIARRYRSPGIAAEAFYLVLRYLFQYFPLRKVYAEAYEYNTMSLRLLKRIGFVEEGRSKEHLWYKDQYWDLIRLALFRGNWSMSPERFEQMIHDLANPTHDLDRQLDRA